MERTWSKQTTKRQGQAEQQIQEEQPFREVEGSEVWDFSRESHAQQAGFKFKRRAENFPAFRVVGEASHSNTETKLLPSGTSSAQVRPNRFNAGVKMVTNAAPWEEKRTVNYLKLPVTGEVAAGRYDVTVAYHESGSDVDADFVMLNAGDVKVNRNTFALRVRGESMIDNEIEDGDIIIVQAQDWADDGDFVIACLTDSSDVNGFVTLKRFYRHRQADRVVLQPANKSLSPIHILPRKGDAHSEDLDGVKIQGRVTAVIKTGHF